MIVLYTSPGCASCRKAKAWLKENNIKYVEKNIFTTLLKDSEIKYLLSRSENGLDDIVSKRSKIIKESNVDIDSMSTNEVIEFIQNNPSVLKRPILFDERNMMIGYDEEEIEIFNTKEIENYISLRCAGDKCQNYDSCGKFREDSNN